MAARVTAPAAGALAHSDIPGPVRPVGLAIGLGMLLAFAYAAPIMIGIATPLFTC